MSGPSTQRKLADPREDGLHETRQRFAPAGNKYLLAAATGLPAASKPAPTATPVAIEPEAPWTTVTRHKPRRPATGATAVAAATSPTGSRSPRNLTLAAYVAAQLPQSSPPASKKPSPWRSAARASTTATPTSKPSAAATGIWTTVPRRKRGKGTAASPAAGR